MLLFFMLLYTGWVEVDTTIDTLYNPILKLVTSSKDSCVEFIVAEGYFPYKAVWVEANTDTFVFKTDMKLRVVASDWIYDFTYDLWAIDLALRAREGDTGAKAMLDFWGIMIKDDNGKLLYPIKPVVK